MPVLVDARPCDRRGQHHRRVSRAAVIPRRTRLLPADPASGTERSDARPVLRQLRHDADAEDRVSTASARPKTAIPTRDDRQARRLLDVAYDWLDDALARPHLGLRRDFSLADCAAAPALFYADWCAPRWAATHANVRAYRSRLLSRPSFARAVDEARPYSRCFRPVRRIVTDPPSG